MRGFLKRVHCQRCFGTQATRLFMRIWDAACRSKQFMLSCTFQLSGVPYSCRLETRDVLRIPAVDRQARNCRAREPPAVIVRWPVQSKHRKLRSSGLSDPRQL
ncbi:unnamed protein product [Scytosiphon promiscuus]